MYCKYIKILLVLWHYLEPLEDTLGGFSPASRDGLLDLEWLDCPAGGIRKDPLLPLSSSSPRDLRSGLGLMLSPWMLFEASFTSCDIELRKFIFSTKDELV